MDLEKLFRCEKIITYNMHTHIPSFAHIIFPIATFLKFLNNSFKKLGILIYLIHRLQTNLHLIDIFHE